MAVIARADGIELDGRNSSIRKSFHDIVRQTRLFAERNKTSRLDEAGKRAVRSTVIVFPFFPPAKP
jgi:hypothetical protein